MIHREISDKRFQMDSLDGLRGFAALIVVFSHVSNTGIHFLPIMDLRGTGKSGVFLFFLLSSFLLTLPLLKMGKKIFTLSNISHYWQRRFFRIYPLYSLYLLLGLITTWLFANYLGKANAGIPLILDWSSFIQHLSLQEGKGVTWSIAVEFKFYFFLPIIALITVYLLSFSFSLTVLFFLVIIIASQVAYPQSDSLTNDPRLMPYLPIFFIGMLLAVIQNKINSHEIVTRKFNYLFKISGIIGVSGLLLMTPLVYSFFFDEVKNVYFHKQFILYSILWSLVILSAVNTTGFIQTLFTSPILAFYGALSFSVYLFHPVFIELIGSFNINGYLSAWLILFTTTVSSYISFKLIEGPISKFKIRRSSLPSIFR